MSSFSAAAEEESVSKSVVSSSPHGFDSQENVSSVLSQLSPSETSQLVGPHMVHRHLRAHKGDVSKALSGLQSTLSWRQSFDVAGLLSRADPSSRFAAVQQENVAGKLFVRGADKAGRALLHFRPRTECTFDGEANLQHLVFNLEKAIAASKVNGQEMIVLIIDYNGYGYRNIMPFA